MRKENTQEKEVNVLTKQLKGIALWPRLEDGTFSFKLLLSDIDYGELEKELLNMDGEIITKDIAHNNQDYIGINVKTSYECPVFDAKGTLLEDDKYEIYHGAEIIAKVQFKVQPYKRRNYIVGYLKGAVVIEQGENSNETKFEEFEDMLKDVTAF